MSKYVQYGIPSSWTKEFEIKGISTTTFKNTSNKNLIERYNISEDKVKFVKSRLKRKPIDGDTLQSLLERNRFVCCLCKGQKSDAYIIHHIEAYSISQDNNYYNLAVLCPNDHDLVHREGENLTNKIPKEQVEKAKINWEKEVEALNVAVASQSLEIGEVDFLNFNRILELYHQLYSNPPHTKYKDQLEELKALDNLGGISIDFLKNNNYNENSPFVFWGPAGSWALSLHYTDLFKQILSTLQFTDLDHLLSVKKIKNILSEEKFCFYAGGLYGKNPGKPGTNSEITHLYFHRRKFYVEWTFDTKYMISTSSYIRLSHRTEYLIYGKIRTIENRMINGKEYIYINIRPYLFGLALRTKTRRPSIHYRDKFTDEEN
ncbi:HNH endonuclease [Chryseobacterium sp. 5_R23647]|uniref:HNH endonuclease n=1 Tax=Chryseobacterium sp. 5_R23647 TaxID=2258964 RepID=UPI000E229D43|nr:HNH endonuclease [Chryseobacterium sp. 5_R23647]REC42019.1 hypothetical protein DRF69_12715 [Chryseobacterium sp. 5_R23647]